MVSLCLKTGCILDDERNLQAILNSEKKESSVTNGLRDTGNYTVSDRVNVDNMPLEHVYTLSQALLQAMHTDMDMDREREREGEGERGSLGDGHRVDKNSMYGDRNNSVDSPSEYSEHNVDNNFVSSSSSSSSSSSCVTSREGNISSAVLGKHVLVSMGNRGVLWCTSSSGTPETGRTYGSCNTHYMQCNGRTYSATHMPAVPLNVVSTDVFDTNGAGDAFCAGFVHHLLSVQNRDRDNSGGLGGTGLGSAGHMIRSVEAGLRTAHSKILSSVVSVNKK
jgi:hypothetical protein